jgi:hypothetical protein
MRGSLLALTLILAVAACRHDSAGGTEPDAATTIEPSADASPAPMPGRTVSFASEVQPILTTSCTYSLCHDRESPAATLNLEAGAAYGSLVGVNAMDSCTSWKRVAPGQPDASYIVMKLAGSGACFANLRMPKNEPALSAAQQQLIRDWIANGAPNN